MRRIITIILFLILIITNVKGAYNFNYVNESNNINTSVEITDSAFSFELDLGLGTNLLQDVQDMIIDQLDELFNPIIEELKDFKKENIQRLNYTDSPTSDKMNYVMSLLGLNDGLFAGDKICDEKDESSFCDYYGKSQYFAFSSLTPQSIIDFRQKIDKIHKDLVDEVKTTGENFRNQVNDAWDAAFSELKVDEFINARMEEVFSGDLVVDYLMDKIEKQDFFQSQSDESNAVLGMIRGTKSPQQVAMIYAKNADKEGKIFNYDKVNLKYGKNIQPSSQGNNLCDLAMDLFSDNENMSDKLNERLSKLRQELYKYATYMLTKTLMDDLEIITIMQTLGKMTQCAIEASIASASAIAEMYGMPSFVSSAALSAISSTADISEHRTAAAKAQDCMQEIDDKNKEELDIESEVGLSNFGVTFFPLTILDLWVFSPLSNLALGVKGKTNVLTQWMKSDANYERCLKKGESSVWVQAYDSCMAGNSGIEFKIKSDLNKEIGRLFNTVRKNKKNNCKLLDESTKLNLFYFDKIKILFEPTPVVGKFIDDGTLNYFGAFVSKLVQAKIETPTELTKEMAFYKKELKEIRENIPFEYKKPDGTLTQTRIFNSIQDLMDCGGVDTKNHGPYICSTSGSFSPSLPTEDDVPGLEEINGYKSKVGLRNFCSYQVEDLILNKKFKQIIKDSTTDNKHKKPKFSKEMIETLSNINHCAMMLADIVEHPIEQLITTGFAEPLDSVQGSMSYLIDKKWMLETKQLTQKEFEQAMQVYKATEGRFSSLTKGEKIKLCVNTRKKEDILNTSMMYKLCKSFKIQLFNEIFTDAKTSFKSANYSSKNSFKSIMEDVSLKSEQLSDDFNID